MLGVNAASVIQFMVNECCNWRRTLGWKVALKGHGFSRAAKSQLWRGFSPWGSDSSPPRREGQRM